MWLNEIRVNGLVQDPSAIGLTFTGTNKEQTIVDIWNGWTEVRLTNFDLNGDPFIPTVGAIVTDSASGNTATIAYVERAFSTVRLFLKDKSGPWALGSDFSANSNVSFIENDSTVRIIGPVSNTHLENTISGPLIIFDTGVNIPIVASGTNYLRDLEYWLYSDTVIQGIMSNVLGFCLC